MHKGKIPKAESITKRISQSIAEHSKSIFASSRRGSKELWDKVRQITGKNKSQSCFNHITVDQLNQHFSNISTDQQYATPLPKVTVSLSSQPEFFTEYRVFLMLDQIKNTSAGLENLPHWFLQLGASSFSPPLSHIFNLSLHQSTVPTQWKSSTITPV